MLMSDAVSTADPTVTTTLFRVAQCQDFGEASFHEDDYNIDCNTTKFMLIQAFAFFVILLIPIGIPAAFAFLMWRAKQSLGGVVYETATGGAKLSTDDVDEEADAYGFLTGDYRPDCYYYEIVCYSKKLVLSGVSVMVGRGTLAQICMCSVNRSSLFVLAVGSLTVALFLRRLCDHGRSVLPYASRAHLSVCRLQTQRDRSARTSGECPLRPSSLLVRSDPRCLCGLSAVHACI